MVADKNTSKGEVPVVVLDDGDFSKREIVTSPDPGVYVPTVEHPHR